jgi:hypothetical protein
MTNLPAWSAIACAAVALVALARGHAAVRGTTLIGAWSWAVAALVSLLAITSAELSPQGEAPAFFAPLQFAAASLTLCPVVAVLGAKRPQDRAWHGVVLSLWIVLCIPAVNAAFFHPGGGVELHAAQITFLAVLIFLGIANYLPTRYAVFSLLAAISQSLLFREQWPVVPLIREPHAWDAGVALYAIALAVSPLARRSRGRNTESLDAAWRDFRDDYGSFWALRVLTRFNASAGANLWPVRIAWSGFRQRISESAAKNVAPETIPAIRRCFQSLLRRFV